MAVVERGDLCHTESLGDGDDGRVDDSEPEICVAVDQLADPAAVRVVHVEALDLSQHQRLEEACLGGRSQPGLDQPRRFDDDRDGDRERSGGQGIKQVRAILMPGGRRGRPLRR